jgi:hypothetical protein
MDTVAQLAAQLAAVAVAVVGIAAVERTADRLEGRRLRRSAQLGQASGRQEPVPTGRRWQQPGMLERISQIAFLLFTKFFTKNFLLIYLNHNKKLY